MDNKELELVEIKEEDVEKFLEKSNNKEFINGRGDKKDEQQPVG